jgi:ketosteroid isomerase-like protein
MPDRPALRLAARRLAAIPAAVAAIAIPTLLHAQAPRPAARAATPAPAVPAAEQIAASERAFATAARERGIKEAFMAHMALDGVLFRPGPVPARAWLESNPPSPGILAWEPAWGTASSAGDLGFTTGPFTYRLSESDSAPRHGQYVTVWARQDDGTYKALLDVGVDGPATTIGATFVARPLPAEAARPAGGASAAGIAEAARATLFIADRGLAAAGAADGADAALAAVAAADVRVLRTGRAPTLGRDSLTTVVLPASTGAPLASAGRWRTQEARVARSGDLGVTYGGYETRDAAGALTESGNYVRIWTRQDGGWRVLLDVAAPSR